MHRHPIVCSEQILEHVHRQGRIVIVIVTVIHAPMSASGIQAAATGLAHRYVLAQFKGEQMQVTDPALPARRDTAAIRPPTRRAYESRRMPHIPGD
jgi:hypothetical protein